jgi:hypothetical protein
MNAHPILGLLKAGVPFATTGAFSFAKDPVPRPALQEVLMYVAEIPVALDALMGAAICATQRAKM